MRYLFLLLLLLGIAGKAQTQEMMLNGSFEDFDGNPDGDTVLSTVNYAAYWRNLIGSCDLVHPDVPVDMSGVPCFGVGCGRFGVSTSGYSEFMYGKTLPLTAGQLYEVSFWVRKDHPTEVLRKIGLAITDYVPTPSITSTTPLISHLATTTQCVQLKACFTAESNAVHYVTLGPFGGQGTTESLVYLVDSVSVMTIPPTTPLAQASLSASESILCYGEQVTLDGTGSANETSYEWNIFYPNNGGTNVYSSGRIQGTAGTLTPNLPFALPGACYRAELTVYGICKDVATVEFCIADPNIDFIFDGNPVCENFPVDLQVTGDNGWIYTWKQANDTLSSGVGLKTLTVTPTIGNGTFSVTVTTPEGCTHTETLTLNVNSQTNIAPWMDGINGTGEYTYYVSQGDAVFFNSLLSNDHLNEEILYTTINNTIPSSHLVNLPGLSGGIFSLSWVTSLAIAPGEYHYIFKANDQNACGLGIDTFDFRIIVVCDQCPVCISYEDRSPSGTPLPPETKAGKCIQAGFSEVVSTGTAPVTFIAGKTIELGNFFDAGSGYEGIIDSSTCVTDCEDCCTNWSGFTYDELPNPFIMNFDDSDPTNDFIQVTDMNHPFCAFGAKGYLFEIVDGNGHLMNDLFPFGQTASYCCPFQSPAPENQIPHSPIWWDGYTSVGTGGSHLAHSDVYFYKLTFYGCNGEELLLHGDVNLYRPEDKMIQNPNTQENIAGINRLNTEQQKQLDELQAKKDQLDKAVNVFPNPTTGMIYITGIDTDHIHYQVFDEKGIMLSRKEKLINQNFSLAEYSKGTYYIRIYSGETYVIRKVVKM